MTSSEQRDCVGDATCIHPRCPHHGLGPDSFPEQSDSPRLVQLRSERVTLDRVPRGRAPVVQLELRPSERVVQIKQTYSSDLYHQHMAKDVWREPEDGMRHPVKRARYVRSSQIGGRK